jgi:hypothetical protein
VTTTSTTWSCSSIGTRGTIWHEYANPIRRQVGGRVAREAVVVAAAASETSSVEVERDAGDDRALDRARVDHRSGGFGDAAVARLQRIGIADRHDREAVTVVDAGEGGPLLVFEQFVHKAAGIDLGAVGRIQQDDRRPTDRGGMAQVADGPP